jgi:acyl carrier protein
MQPRWLRPPTEDAADMATRHETERAAILAGLTDIFRLVLADPAVELTLGTTSDDLPCWDSMNHIAIVVEAECRFDIQFQVAEIEDLTSVGELVQLIATKRATVHV